MPEVELETKLIAVKHGVTGVTQEAVDEVQARVDSLKEQLEALDARKAILDGEEED
jgi:hypothetical protein